MRANGKGGLTPPLHDPEWLRHKGAVVPWRTSLARQRRAPVGFIRPCQPVLATEVPTGEGWIHELKWDGYRIIVRRNEGVVRLWSRYGRNWEKEFPRIVGT